MKVISATRLNECHKCNWGIKVKSIMTNIHTYKEGLGMPLSWGCHGLSASTGPRWHRDTVVSSFILISRVTWDLGVQWHKHMRNSHVPGLDPGWQWGEVTGGSRGLEGVHLPISYTRCSLSGAGITQGGLACFLREIPCRTRRAVWMLSLKNSQLWGRRWDGNEDTGTIMQEIIWC